MSREVPAEDLLVLARQCKLSEEEERRFEIAVQSSRELEVLYDAGVHFDVEAGILPGDETRFSRLVERTLANIDAADGAEAPRADSGLRAGRPSRAALAARYFAGSLAFGVLLFVTLASAWDYVEKRSAAGQKERARETAASVSAGRNRKPLTPAAARPLALAPPTGTESSPARASAEQPRGTRLPIATARKSVATEERTNSSELFALANEARRKGDIEAAIALYERLGKEYPSSLEAEDAKVLSGNLLLSQRSPRAALRKFEDYHSEALSLEALWGRAQALRKLESPDEKTILSQLVRDYPDSPYAKAAGKRLRELSR